MKRALTSLTSFTSLTRDRYYITTAINYANGSPHMGHAYEALVTDVVARYERLAVQGAVLLSFD
jgi:methionyl-tRNA synthetase